MRKDRGDPGAHGIAFVYRHLAHGHARHIGYCVERAGRKNAGSYPKFTRTRTLLRANRGSQYNAEHESTFERGC
ncbi:MAG: hypothetical protein NVSMB53_15200 [Gemmatimonadaceae bacterium]